MKHKEKPNEENLMLASSVDLFAVTNFFVSAVTRCCSCLGPFYHGPDITLIEFAVQTRLHVSTRLEFDRSI